MNNGQVQAVQVNAMNAYEGAKIQLHSLLNLTLHGGAWSASRSGRFTSKQRAPIIHWIEAEWSPEEVLTLWKTDKPIFPRRQTVNDSLVSQPMT